MSATSTLFTTQGHARILCRPGDLRLQIKYSERGGLEQWDDDPPFVVIGRDTSDERCARFARDNGLDPVDVIAFRDPAAEETL